MKVELLSASSTISGLVLCNMVEEERNNNTSRWGDLGGRGREKKEKTEREREREGEREKR